MTSPYPLLCQESDEIIARLLKYKLLAPRDGLSSIQKFLSQVGNPHLALPPVIHIAGTNGKGSVTAFLRAILEAAGYRVHVLTSPHLMTVHERIRLAGSPISTAMFHELIDECDQKNSLRDSNYFDLVTTIAFMAFARVPADIVLLETGMGGRLDATNVIPAPLATVITSISHDHMHLLGDSLSEIAREKAGIMKQAAPCIIAPQKDEALYALQGVAQAQTITTHIYGKDWVYHRQEKDNQFSYHGLRFSCDLPAPILPGDHQYENASTAIATFEALPQLTVTQDHLRKGLQTATWPARLQWIKDGALPNILPPGSEILLDGAHNQDGLMRLRHYLDGLPKMPTIGLMAMMKPRDPLPLFQEIAPAFDHLLTIEVPEMDKSFPALGLAQLAAQANVKATALHNFDDLSSAIQNLGYDKIRFVICGSLYLAGYILQQNEMKDHDRRAA